MKRKAGISRIFVAAFAAALLLFSANLVFAQCGSYFKTNYRAIDKLSNSIMQRDALDDWTGDGKSDFWNFRRNPTTSLLDIVIYPAKPTGYWDWDNPIIYTTSILNFHDNGSDSQKVLDFDSDGRTDFYYNFQIHRNAGNGSLTASPAFSDSDSFSPQNIAFADINGDNLLDWLYVVFLGSNPNRAAIRYQLQNPNGTFSNKTTVLETTPENGFFYSNEQLGDFNGDDKIDIIYGTSDINNTRHYVVLKNLGGGTFQMLPPVASDLFIPGVLRDFNNDGIDDLLYDTAIYYGQTSGIFSRVGLAIGSGYAIPAELNGDNNLDIMEIGYQAVPDYYATHISNGAGGFTRTAYPKNFETSLGLKFEDFSGDGKADLYDTRWFQTPHKNIFGDRLIPIRENICNPFGETKLANFDGNYNPDLVMWSAATGNWSSKNATWLASNPMVFNWGLGSHGDIPAPGDFDGDGKTDYSVYRNNTGIWYIFRSADSSWLVFPFGLTGDIAVPNDYNAGGKTDIAVFRPSDGNWYIWFSETQQFLAMHFGASGDKPVPADYDGDNKTDVAVYRPSEGNWYYLKSSDGNYAVFRWGIASDTPVPADYDGDNRADLAIYRTGSWWIWRSSTNSHAVFQWGGGPGNVPMPVYRNSHSADMILYLPDSNTWHSWDLRGGPGFTVGANGDLPVYFGLPNN